MATAPLTISQSKKINLSNYSEEESRLLLKFEELLQQQAAAEAAAIRTANNRPIIDTLVTPVAARNGDKEGITFINRQMGETIRSSAQPVPVGEDVLKIRFKHVPSQYEVGFTAFLESFTDSFDAEWSSEKVFGRMDPIAQYKGTSRKINCSFTIPSDSHEQAYINHRKLSLLLSMMYPSWEQDSNLGVYSITAPPLMIVKFNNLISSTSQTPGISSVMDTGLLGYIPGLKYEPDMNSPLFVINKDNILASKLKSYGDENTTQRNLFSLDGNYIGYQSLKLNFELNVLHTHRMGIYTSADESTNEMVRYPYGFNILRPFKGS